MRKLFAFATIALLAAPVVRAQQQWRSEIGIQGGFVRVKPAGTGRNDHADLFDLPGFNVSPAIPSYATLFFIVPWKPKLAIEPSVAFSQLQQTGSATLIDLGLRLDYALTAKFYAAAGLTASHVNTSGTNTTPLGVLVGVGYRGHLVGPLNGRVEARVNLLKKTNDLNAQDIYGVLLGLSTPLSGSATTPRRAGGGAPAASRSGWSKVIGMAGGYSQLHTVGSSSADVTTLSFPGYGSGFSAFGSGPIVLPTTLFAIFPVGEKLAIEPGLDFHRVQSTGTTTSSTSLSARLDYAIHGGWYAAVGGNLQHFKTTGVSAASRTALSVATGYRFHLVGGLGSRIDLSHTMWKAHDKAPITRPINATSIMWGVTLPLR